jgi:membrane protein YqaA with SNARE-associated domain
MTTTVQTTFKQFRRRRCFFMSSAHAAIGASAAEAHGGWHTWGLPGLFLLGLLDGAGFPTMGGPDVVLIYLCMHASALEVCWIALVAALSEAIGSVVLLQLARAGSDYAQKKLRIPQRWWNAMRKHAAKLPPFWLCALLGMIPPPLPKKVFDAFSSH